MAYSIPEVQEAFQSAGATKAKATAAAAAVADELLKMRADVHLLKWMVGLMVGFNIALTVAILGILIRT